MPDIHYLTRPALVHQLKERAGKKYTAKCGFSSEEPDAMTHMSGSHDRITCDECSPTTGRTS